MDRSVKEYSIWLDTIRGLAALVVFLGHARVVLIGSIVATMGAAGAAIAAKAPTSGKLPELTSFGHIAVIVFFVLSGYLVGGGAIRAMRGGRWSAHDYAIARLSRLWTVLLPMLAIGWVLDHIGYAMAPPASIYYGPPGQAMIFDNMPERMSLANLLGNVVFLQGIVGKPYGSNSPLWSLAYEFWFYVAFPLLLFAVWPGVAPRKRLVCAAALILVGIGVGPRISSYFAFWLLGALVELVPKRLSERRARVLAIGGSMAFVALLGALLKLKLPIFATDLIESVTLAGLLYPVVHLSAERPRDWIAVGASAVAAASYTLYVAHAPLIAFIDGLLMPVWRPWPVNAVGGAKFVAVCSIVMVLAAALWWLFERNTPAVRRCILGLYARTYPDKGELVSSPVASATPPR